MAITTAMNNQFKADLLGGIHDLDTHTVKLALFTSTATLSASSPVTTFSTTNEVSGTGYTTGGVTLGSPVITLNSGVGILDFADASWTTASFTANGACMYNSSVSNKIIANFAFGGDQTVTAGTFSVVFPTADSTNAIIRIS